MPAEQNPPPMQSEFMVQQVPALVPPSQRSATQDPVPDPVQQVSVPDPVHWELSNRQDPVPAPVQQVSVPDPVHWELVGVRGNRSPSR